MESQCRKRKLRQRKERSVKCSQVHRRWRSSEDFADEIEVKLKARSYRRKGSPRDNSGRMGSGSRIGKLTDKGGLTVRTAERRLQGQHSDREILNRLR